MSKNETKLRSKVLIQIHTYTLYYVLCRTNQSPTFKTRFSEHKNNTDPVKTQFVQCGNTWIEGFEMLACTQKTEIHLITLVV